MALSTDHQLVAVVGGQRLAQRMAPLTNGTNQKGKQQKKRGATKFGVTPLGWARTGGGAAADEATPAWRPVG